ncbi:MAG: DapH/DapD/GlmU-related protein [Candidatus Omnitrophota bacterium]|nr:DapH/DapD/GlmU-related protein [Candidatus Omnitrophota bacterium]MDZ4242658.1 DapH/DapD/GlmU-related protein [Candidatus Omnitrophota bacterium]
MGSRAESRFLLSLVTILFTLFMYMAGIVVLGLSIFPGVYFLNQLWTCTASLTAGLRVLYFCFGFVAAYFFSGVMLMALVSLVRVIFRLRLKEGEFQVGSPEIFKWIFVNAFFMVVKVVFLDLILLTPYCALFYRLMGARIGRNVLINSKNVGDLSLLEIGDNSAIGGNATIVAHSFEKGGLKLKKVKIGRNVIIGLNSVILPGAEIGDHAVIAAGAIVPKNTHVAGHVTFLGAHTIDGS